MFRVLVSVVCISQVLATIRSPVDLGYKFDSDTVYWFGSGNFNLTPTLRQETPFWLATNSYSASEHGGTHLDAPFHFNKEGWKVGDIPLERLLVEGVMLDLKNESAQNPDFEVTVQHLSNWEKANGPLPSPVVILFNFGWAKKYTNKTEYFGGNDASNLHFPGLSADVATWIVNTGKVVGVGVDTASIDPGVKTIFPAHKILNGANIYLIENLALKGISLPARSFQLVVMPMKISEGTGAPLRIIAYPYKPASSLYNTIVGWMSSLLARLGFSF